MQDSWLRICLLVQIILALPSVIFAQAPAQKIPAINKEKLPVLYLHKREELPSKSTSLRVIINEAGEVTTVSIPHEKCTKTRLHKFVRELHFSPSVNGENTRTLDLYLSMGTVTKNAKRTLIQLEPYNFKYKAKIKRYDSFSHEDCGPPFVKISFGEIKRKQ